MSVLKVLHCSLLPPSLHTLCGLLNFTASAQTSQEVPRPSKVRLIVFPMCSFAAFVHVSQPLPPEPNGLPCLSFPLGGTGNSMRQGS